MAEACKFSRVHEENLLRRLEQIFIVNYVTTFDSLDVEKIDLRLFASPGMHHGSLSLGSYYVKVFRFCPNKRNNRFTNRTVRVRNFEPTARSSTGTRREKAWRIQGRE
jgi:hypothetical protein